MPTYEIALVLAPGHVAPRVRMEFGSDDDTMRAAKQMLTDNWAAEVWNGRRKVGFVSRAEPTRRIGAL